MGVNSIFTFSLIKKDDHYCKCCFPYNTINIEGWAKSWSNFFITFLFEVPLFSDFHMCNNVHISISRLKCHKSNSTLNNFIFTLKSARFTTPEHTINSLVSCFKNYKISKLSDSNLLKLHQCQGWCHLTICVKFWTSLPKNNGINDRFCEPYRRKNTVKYGCMGCERNSHSDKILFELMIFADWNL